MLIINKFNYTKWVTSWDISVYQCIYAAAAAAAAASLQSCPTLYNPTDGSPPGSPVPGIIQARIVQWVAIFFSNAWKWKSEVAQSCPTPSDPMDCSPPGPSVHGIFQARVPVPGILQARTLEWVAISFSNAWKWKVKVRQILIHCTTREVPNRPTLSWIHSNKTFSAQWSTRIGLIEITNGLHVVKSFSERQMHLTWPLTAPDTIIISPS